MSSNHSEFIAIYGRRRVGKTFLIRQYFQNQFAFDMTGIIEGKKAEQLTAFSHAMKQHGYKGRKPATWLDAFFALRGLLEQKLEQGKPCVVFIDEMPCLDTPKSGFVHALGHFLNQPFPDRDSLNGEAVFYYLPFSIPRNDDTLILLIGFQEFDESTHFALVSVKVIDAVRHLNGFTRLGYAKVYFHAFIIIEKTQLFWRVVIAIVQLDSNDVLQQFCFAARQEKVQYAIIGEIALHDGLLLSQR